MVWSSLDTGFVAMHTQKDIDDLKTPGANLVILACEGTYVEDFPEYYTIDYANDDAWFTEEVLETMVRYCQKAGLHYIILPEAAPEEIQTKVLTERRVLSKNWFKYERGTIFSLYHYFAFFFRSIQ